MFHPTIFLVCNFCNRGASRLVEPGRGHTSDGKRIGKARLVGTRLSPGRSTVFVPLNELCKVLYIPALGSRKRAWTSTQSKCPNRGVQQGKQKTKKPTNQANKQKPNTKTPKTNLIINHIDARPCPRTRISRIFDSVSAVELFEQRGAIWDGRRHSLQNLRLFGRSFLPRVFSHEFCCRYSVLRSPLRRRYPGMHNATVALPVAISHKASLKPNVALLQP